MPPQFPLPSERQTAYLRASVVDAALTLGPNVTNLIFADGVLENPLEDSDKGGKVVGCLFFSYSLLWKRKKKLYIPDLYSLSPSTAAGPFSAFSHDTDFSSSSSGNGSGSSRYGKSPVSKSRGARFNKDDLESPFVVISRTGESQDDDITSGQMNGTTSKKGIKNFTFLSRKLQHTASKESSPERGRPTISNPRRLHAALDDPVLPIMIYMPSPRASARSEGPTNSAQSTPTKSRKRIQQVGSDDLNLFTGKSSGSKALVKPNKKKGQDEDSGYVSEGTGLSSLKSKARRKGKYSTSPPPDGKNRVQSAATTQQQKSTDPQSSVPVPALPIAERFVRKKPSVPQPLKIPQIKFPSPAPAPPPDKIDNGNGNISLPNSSFLVVGSTPQFPNAKNSPISDKSFVMVPDLNIMKRLGLDKYVSEINASSGPIGANNEIKLQVMEMLLKNTKDRSPELKKKSENSDSFIAEVTTEPIPAINVVPPRTTQEPMNRTTTAKIESQFPPPPTPVIRGRDSPFSKAPIRGRESPFPTKPIFPGAMMAYSLPVSRSPSAVRGGPGPLRFKLPSPDGYKNMGIDLPRSVRSSYEKDLEREEEEAPSSSISDRVKARRAVAGVNANNGRGGEYGYDYDVNLDSPSVYSSHFEIDNLAGRRI